jgi:stage II sporulation protein D
MKILKTCIAASLVACSLNPTQLLSVGVEVPTDLSQKNKPATIKVLIAKQKEKALLEVKGRYFLYNPLNGMLISQESSPRRSVIASTSSGLRWKEPLPSIYQIRIVPGDSQSTVLVDGIEYRGCVEVYDIGGKLYVVNEVDIERYLKSVMTTQFPSEMDEEVMDAVAIVARTNAYHLISKQQHSHWHVAAQDVGYQGDALTLQNLHVDRAINSTRHMVLTYHNAPFATAWTQDSAGKTAAFASIFRKNVETPHGVQTPFAARDRDKHSWSLSMSKFELAKLIGTKTIAALDLYQDPDSQRVYGIRIKDGDDVRQLDFFKLQQMIGANRLKSNDFTVQLTGDRVVIKGFGEGHGVGLCLYSASQMAERGETAPKILSAFFPETKLQNMRSIAPKVESFTAENNSSGRYVR